MQIEFSRWLQFFNFPSFYSNNLDNQQRLRSPNRLEAINQQTASDNEVKSNQGDIRYSNRIDIYSDGTESGVKNDEPTSEDERPPRLPPRPPPRPRNNTLTNDIGKSFGVIKFFRILIFYKASKAPKIPSITLDLNKSCRDKRHKNSNFPLKFHTETHKWIFQFSSDNIVSNFMVFLSKRAKVIKQVIKFSRR